MRVFAARLNFSNSGRFRGRIKSFTLLELLIAMCVLVLGLASIFAVFGIGAQSHRRGVNDVVLSSYAETVLAEAQHNLIKGQLLMDAVNQTHPNFPSNLKYDITFKDLTAAARRLVEPDGVEMAREILVTITIKWSSVRGTESEKFQTVLTQ